MRELVGAKRVVVEGPPSPLPFLRGWIFGSEDCGGLEREGEGWDGCMDVCMYYAGGCGLATMLNRFWKRYKPGRLKTETETELKLN